VPLQRRAQDKFRDFRVGVSYKAGNNDGKFLDARNVNTVQKRLDTRFGTSRRNAVALPGKIQSLSSFVKADGTVYELAKVGQKMYLLAETGAHTVLKEQLNENAKHRGITVNNRHIMAIGDDGAYGLYSYDGETFTILGQVAPPVKPTGTAGGSGGTLPASTYRVAITFYASSIGLESNYTESDDIVVTSGQKITVGNMAETAANDLIDKVFIYLKDITADGEFLFVEEINLVDAGDGYEIGEPSASAETPPVNNGAPQQGGGKFITQYGRETVYAGRTGFENEVYFSEPDLPDAYNPNGDQKVLVIGENGGITGLCTGLFSDSHLSPYLVIFKRKSIHIYSDLLGDGTGNLVCINNQIGCVSQDTVILRNGVIYFLSEEGWRAIYNGKLIEKDGEAVTLGNGDIDDIFRSPGWIYEVNRSNIDEAFSIYYPALNQYMTWLAEGVNDAFTKTYSYEFEVGGFKPFEFKVPGTCACLSKDSEGRDIVLIGTANGFVLKHSLYESRSDVDESGAEVAIPAYGILPWAPEDPDFDATYNYRELMVKSVVSGTVNIKTFLNYSLADIQTGELDFTSSEEGFTLDEDALDEGVFGDERKIRPARFDIHRVGESIAIGFYQEEVGGNMGLVSIQLDLSKNGNRNMPGAESEDDIFGSEEDLLQFVTTPSETLELISALSARIQELENMLNLGNQNTDDSWRFFNDSGVLKTQKRIAGVWVDESEKSL
jgi:hypothetical protein